MATKVNEILQFASQDTGSNLLTQSEYDGDAQRVIGHQPGIARSRLENKVLRQCSTMSAGLAEFVLQNQDGSVTDSMSPQEIAAALTSAIGGIGGTNIRDLNNVTTATWSDGLSNFELLRFNPKLVEIAGNGISIITGLAYCVLKAVKNINSGASYGGRLNMFIDGKSPITGQMQTITGVGAGYTTSSITWRNVYGTYGSNTNGETFAILADYTTISQVPANTQVSFWSLMFALQ